MSLSALSPNKNGPNRLKSSNRLRQAMRIGFAALAVAGILAGCGGGNKHSRLVNKTSILPLPTGNVPPHSPMATVGNPEGAPLTAGQTGVAPIAAAGGASTSESELQGPAAELLDIKIVEGAPIALLAPLSGAHAKAGKSLLDGAQMALFDIGNPDARLLPFDTRGTTGGAATAVRQALEQGARIILGPLLAGSVEAAKPLATSRGVPMIAFSNSSAVAEEGVYLAGFTPEQQVRAVVGDAIAEGRLNFAVLAPSNAYGEVVVAALQRTATDYGASITKLNFYNPQGTDFSGPIRSISNYDQRHKALIKQRRELAGNEDEASKRALRALENLDTVGDPPFDAILVPATSAQTLRILSAQLAYFDVDQPIVRILGLQPWDNFGNISNEPALIGARYPAPPSDKRAVFAQRYAQTFGYSPARLASLAYDITALAVSLAKSGRDADFSAASLTNPNGYNGTEGLFRFRQNGVAERGYAIMEITKGGTQTLLPAPTSFSPAIN